MVRTNRWQPVSIAVALSNRPRQRRPALLAFHPYAYDAYDLCVIARHGHPSSRASSMRELLDQDRAFNFTVATYPSMMQDLFWQHGINIESRRLHCAHSAAFLLELARGQIARRHAHQQRGRGLIEADQQDHAVHRIAANRLFLRAQDSATGHCVEVAPRREK